MSKLKKWFEQLRCKHDWECLNHTIINNEEGYFAEERWVHKCRKCGKLSMSGRTPHDKRWFI